MSLMQSLKRPAVLGTLLAVSATINLFLGGILAGRIGAHAMHPPHFERDFESRLRAVPEERRRQIRDMLREGKPARHVKRSTPEDEKAFQELQLLTSKPVLYVCNVAEADAATGNSMTEAVAAYAKTHEAGTVITTSLTSMSSPRFCLK